MVRNNDRAAMRCHATKVVSRLDSAVVCGTCFAEPDMFSVFESCFGVSGGRTRLAMPKTILRAGLIVIEAWFRGY